MCSKFIEDYSFGNIVIEGERYTDDVILLGKEVEPGWWRKSGHRVVKRDLGDILAFDPDILVIGTGSSGRMSVPSSLSEKLDFKVESYPTKQACERYNKLLEGHKKISGGFHLTC